MAPAHPEQMTEYPSLLTYNKQLEEAYAIRGNNLPKSIALATHVLNSADPKQEDVYIARAANLLSLFHVIQCNFDLAIQFATQALTISLKRSDTKGIADSYYNLASVHYRRDNFHLGLDYLLKCLRLYSDLGDHHNLARVNKSMGTVYEYFGDYASAETAYRKCIEASKLANDVNSESNAYNPLSGLLIKKGLLKDAEEMAEMAVKIKEKTNDQRGLAFSLYARGKVSLINKQYTPALADFSDALDIHRQYGDQLGVGMTYNKISAAYFEANQFETSREAAQKTLIIAQQNGIEFLRFKAYYRLYLIAKKENNLEQTLSFLEKYVTAKETVINERTRNIIRSYAAISEIENLEKEANAQKEKNEIIERKNDELDSFFYRVSHDLKGPISSLMGLYNVAKMEVKDEVALQYLGMFNGQTMRINNIVLSLIDLIKLRSDAPKVQIDFSALVDECVTSCFYLEKFSSVKIIKEIEPGISFYSEWAIINTILQNLIENAIKYSRGAVSSFVQIKIYAENNRLIIAVIDNGEGIPEVLQASMFNMFVRGDSRHKGSGLGLYILNRAVERINGIICVDSKIQEGSTFTVSLPLH